MIWFRGIPITRLPKKKAPKYIQEKFDFMKRRLGQDNVKLRYIPKWATKIICPQLSVGQIGYACSKNNTCYVVQGHHTDIYSDLSVAIHELRHFVDGPHPWPEERTQKEK